MADRHNRDIDRPLAPAPKPLPVPTVDGHAHLEIVTDAAPDSAEVKQVLDDAKAVGVDRVVQVGYSAEQSKWCVAAAEHFDDRVLAAVALHPNEAPVVSDLDADLKIIEELANHPRVRAIGETGLDFFRTESEQGKSFQQHSFERHIQIAKDFGLALQIHDRDAHEQVVETLLRVGAPEKVVFHCYSGDIELAKICAEHGWYTSFAGNITIKRNQHLRDSFRHMPKSLILVETDAPFLTPEPLRGRPNAPYLVPITVRFMAAELGMDANELSGQLAKNTVAVYGSWGS